MTRRGVPPATVRPPSRGATCLAAALTALPAGALVVVAVVATGTATAWRDAGRTATIVVPDGTASDAVAAMLAALPPSIGRHRLDPAALSALLAPANASPPPVLPAAFALHPAPGTTLPPDLAARLAAAAPGTLLETTDPAPFDRVSATARGVRLGAIAVLPVLAIAFAVRIAAASRAALHAGAAAITLLHDLGAPDRLIGNRFHRRAIAATFGGALLGALPPAALLALPPPLLPIPSGDLSDAPVPLFALLAAVPPLLAAIAGTVSHVAVRSFLRRMP